MVKINIDIGYSGKENIILKKNNQHDLRAYNQGSNEVWEVEKASSEVRFKLELRKRFST